jgi:hypothetical protein
MGMDVYGVKPKSKKGEYFRNNIWYWRPLSLFIQDSYPEIAAKCKYWDSNDGYGLSSKDSAILGKMILNDIADGTVARWKAEYDYKLSLLEREKCELCEATGIRTDKVGIEMGMPDAELQDAVQILTGRTHGFCNGCKGVGTKENWFVSYPFDIENVESFAQFLIRCGGFSIC